MPRMLLLAVSICCVLGAVNQVEAAKRRGAVVVSPKCNSEVQREAEVVGKLQVQGQPVVVVRPEKGDGSWWIQPAPELGERGHFKAKARFGSSTSKKGDKFFVAILVLRTRQEFEFIKDREFIGELPAAIAQSEPVSVVLGESAKKDPDQPPSR